MCIHALEMFSDKTCWMVGWGASTTGNVSSSGAQQTPRTTWWTPTREVPGAFSWEWGDKKYSNWHLQTGESTSHTIYWQGAIDSLACPDIGNWQNQIAHFLLCSWKSAIVKQAVFIFKTDPQENTRHFWDLFFMAKAWIEKKERTWFSVFSRVTKAAKGACIKYARRPGGRGFRPITCRLVHEGRGGCSIECACTKGPEMKTMFPKSPKMNLS